ncbi:hypothetical protein TTHERM_00989380 (macronuclear) [Tetrahymena thermophila SB210]|uniref:Transmembrane protein n=1 Tax=Tetrahymena thermophila (strain SB210) TaxID=312017 RepID=Q240L1_TETTS|nr:hypothetical protein TTHERM_00989380 [Tetrahymena thermophila SB210]EAS02197.2 hypothetical protein TTHERM_00989380 [Tetrahymena thermophila SB210]|eukprot:XP_001022442.2 hypothetical protein TTHERM_00989380 [Tetrahymena thermophila SB210]
MNSKLMRLSFFLIVIEVIQFVKPKQCNIGCQTCQDNSIDECIQCYSGYQLDDQRQSCKYQQCSVNQFFQIDNVSVSDQIGKCVSICNPLHQENIITNLCDQLQQCPSVFQTNQNLANLVKLNDFFVFQNKQYVALLEDRLSIYNKNDLYLVKSYLYEAGDINVLNLNGQVFVVTNTSAIYYWDFLQGSRLLLSQYQNEQESFSLAVISMLNQFVYIQINENTQTKFQVIYDQPNYQVLNADPIIIQNIGNNSFNQSLIILFQSNNQQYPSNLINFLTTGQQGVILCVFENSIEQIDTNNQIQTSLLQIPQIEKVRQISIGSQKSDLKSVDLESKIIENFNLPFPTAQSQVNSLLNIYNPSMLLTCHDNGDIFFYDTSRGTNIRLIVKKNFNLNTCIQIEILANNKVIALSQSRILLINIYQQEIESELNDIKNLIQLTSNYDKFVINSQSCVQIFSQEFISLFEECNSDFSNNNLNIALNNDLKVITQKVQSISLYQIDLINKIVYLIKTLQIQNNIIFFDVVKIYNSDEDKLINSYTLDELIYFDSQQSFNVYNISLQLVYQVIIIDIKQIIQAKRTINGNQAYFILGQQAQDDSKSALIGLIKSSPNYQIMLKLSYSPLLDDSFMYNNQCGNTFYYTKVIVPFNFFTVFQEIEIDFQRDITYFSGLDIIHFDTLTNYARKMIGPPLNYINYVGTSSGLVQSAKQQQFRYQQLNNKEILSQTNTDDQIIEIIQSAQLGMYFVRTKYKITVFSIFTNNLVEVLSTKSKNDDPFTQLRLINDIQGVICWNQKQILVAKYGENSQKFYYQGMNLINGLIFDSQQLLFYAYGSDFVVLNTFLSVTQIVEQSEYSLNLKQNYISAPSGFNIVKYIYVEFLQLVILYANVSTFSQIYIYDFVTCENTQKISQAFTQNKIGDVVAMELDIISVCVLFLDTYGNLQVNILYNDFSIQNNFKITEIQDRNEQLVGFSYDSITSNIFVYSTTSIYQINYSIAGYKYEAQLYDSHKLFAPIPIDNQNIDFLIFNNDNTIFRYSQQYIKYELTIENSKIVDLLYDSNSDTLIFGLADSILFYINYQFSKNSNLPTQIVKGENVKFLKFLSKNLYLTSDKRVLLYNIKSGQLLFNFTLDQQNVATKYLVNDSCNLLLIGFSDGQLLQFDLINQSYHQYREQSNDILNSSVIEIVLTQDYSQAIFVTNGGILTRIDLIKQVILEKLNLISIVNEDPRITLIEFLHDEAFKRYLFIFSGQKRVYVYNYSTNQLEKYLTLANDQGNILKINELYIFIKSSFQITLYNLDKTLQLSQVIQKNFQDDQIVDYVVIQNSIIIIFFIQKYEVFLLQRNQNSLISHQIQEYPRLLDYIYNEVQGQLKVYVLHTQGVLENNYNLNIQNSTAYTECSIQIQGSDVSKIQQQINSITPKQIETYSELGLTTQNDDQWKNIVFLSLSNDQFKAINQFISDQSSQNTKFIFTSPNNLDNSFDFQNLQYASIQIFYFANYSLQFNNDTSQEFLNIKLNEKIQTIKWQNISISNQCLRNQQIIIQDVQTVVFQNLTINELSVCNQTNQQKVDSLFKFTNVSSIQFYDIEISNNKFLEQCDFTLFKFNDVQNININMLKVTKSKYIKNMFSFQQVSNITIQNAYVASNDNRQIENSQVYLIIYKQEYYTFTFNGCQSIVITDSIFENNNQVSLFYSTNEYNETNYLITWLDDQITLINVQFKQNINIPQQSKQQELIYLQNNYINISNITYSQNIGTFQISQSQIIQIENSSFEGNQAYNGGAINFQNIMQQISFSQTNFSNNTALSSGGALFFQDIGSCQVNFDSNTKIYQNKALIGGGLRIISSNQNDLLIPVYFPFTENVQQNFAEIYGNDCATYLQLIEIQSIQNTTLENNYTFNFYQDMTLAPSNYQFFYSQYAQFLDFQSGNMINLRIYLLDNYNRYLNFSLEKLTSGGYPTEVDLELKNIEIQIEILNSQQSQLIGQKILNYNSFQDDAQFFQLSDLYVQGALQTVQYFTLNSNIYQSSQNSMPILLSVQFRNCIQGEIIQKITNNIFVCKYCSEGTYSLQNPDILFKESQNSEAELKNECINCPQYALQCQGSTILLRNGYWRQDNTTDQILQCNLQVDSCQAEDPQSINYCTMGYIGPLCSQCDILGEVWEGTNYCESCLILYLTALSALELSILPILWLYYSDFQIEQQLFQMQLELKASQNISQFIENTQTSEIFNRISSLSSQINQNTDQSKRREIKKKPSIFQTSKPIKKKKILDQQDTNSELLNIKALSTSNYSSKLESEQYTTEGIETPTQKRKFTYLNNRKISFLLKKQNSGSQSPKSDFSNMLNIQKYQQQTEEQDPKKVQRYLLSPKLFNQTLSKNQNDYDFIIQSQEQ